MAAALTWKRLAKELTASSSSRSKSCFLIVELLHDPEHRKRDFRILDEVTLLEVLDEGARKLELTAPLLEEAVGQAPRSVCGSPNRRTLKSRAEACRVS